MVTITLPKGKLVRLGLLIVALIVLGGLITVYAQGVQSANKAEESMATVLSVNFQEGWEEDLKPICTETGWLFWTSQLKVLEQARRATGLTVDDVKAEAVGRGEPYEGVAGKGQIVTLRLKITSHNADGQTFNDESTIRVLMIQDGDKWLLDGPVPEIPAKTAKEGK